MKKLTLLLLTIVAIAVVVILFTSCEEQPGVYKPGKKISKVYEQNEGEPEYLIEEWKWDGKKLSSITYYWKGNFNAKDEFIYEGNRLVKIRDNLGYSADYFYVGKQFEKIKYYDPTGVLLAEITVHYDGAKISMFTFQNYSAEKNVISMIERGLMGKLLQEEGMQMVSKRLVNPTKESFVITLTYGGDNLASITAESESVTYADYDTYSNVLYNFFPFFTCDNIDFFVFSKNNPRKSIAQLEFITTSIFTYTYDGDFPVTIKKNEVYEDEDGVESFVSATRIEYK